MREQPADQNGCSVSNEEAAPPVKRKKKKEMEIVECSSTCLVPSSLPRPNRRPRLPVLPGREHGRAEEPGFGASPCVC